MDLIELAMGIRKESSKLLTSDGEGAGPTPFKKKEEFGAEILFTKD